MVDRSLMGLAADRGVTICFADLDGADGLWVPEERTILVSRGLSESRVNEVIEHELAHVAIDDQHAELDAGVFRPPPGPLQTLLARRWATPALSAAAFVALIGGVTVGLAAALPDDGSQGITTPSPVAGTNLPVPPEPTTTVVRTVDQQGRVVYKTIVYTPTPGSPAPTPSATVSTTVPVPSGMPASPTRNPTRTTSPAPPVQTTTAPPPVVTTSPEPSPTIVNPTSPAGASLPGDAGDTPINPGDELPVSTGPTG